MTDNLGQNITIWFSHSSPWPNQSTTLHNVTEIHWNYRNEMARDKGRPLAGHLNESMVAFESNIHGTGTTHPTHYITEFEAVTAKEKHDAFGAT